MFFKEPTFVSVLVFWPHLMACGILVPQRGIKLRWSPNHWTSREFPSKNQLLVSLIFFIVFLFSVLFISILIFIISFLLLALGLVCSSFSSSLSYKVRLLIWYLFFFLLYCVARGILFPLTTDWTRAPCIASAESQPMDRQGSPIFLVFLIEYSWFTMLC